MGDNQKPFHNPFAALGALRGVQPDPSEPPASPAPGQTSQAPRLMPQASKTIARAVVRLERSGRGGKEVTVIDHLDVNDAERAEWLKALKSSLGCGGTLDGERLVLQGYQRDRLRPILAGRGVKKITVA